MWPGRVQPDPLAPGQLDDLAVVDADRRHRRLEEARREAGGADPHPPLERELWPSPPHGGGSHGRRRPPATAASTSSTSTSGGSLRSQIIRKRWWVTISAPVSDRTQPAPPKWSGWLWVTIDGVHPLQRDAGAGQPLGELGERAPPGQPGVDDGDAARVLEDVAVDVAEAGHVDRQLGAQHAGGDLGDLGRGALLLLATGAIGHHRTIVGGPDRAGATPASSRLATVASATIGRWLGLCTPSAGRSAGCCCGRHRRLPAPPTTARPPLAVVVPARDEAAALPAPARPAGPQLRPGDELVVVDDHSADDTAAVARAVGVRVVRAPAAARRLGRQAARLRRPVPRRRRRADARLPRRRRARRARTCSTASPPPSTGARRRRLGAAVARRRAAGRAADACWPTSSP